jgi:hypothetical protein
MNSIFASRLFQFQKKPSAFHPRAQRTALRRLASAIQIVGPSESTAETQPKFQPFFVEIVRDDFALRRNSSSKRWI